jgi:ankyrin repeat protein
MREKRVPILVVLGVAWCFAQCFAAAQETPLHKAAAAGDKALVARLLDEGAAVNVTDKYGATPLHYAAAQGEKEVAELLLARGADINASLAREPIRDDATKVISFLAPQWKGQTPLHWAAVIGDKGLVELLLAKGAAVDPRDDNLWTPLHRAAFWGRLQAAELLLAKGAEVDAKDIIGRTALHVLGEDDKALAELLLAKGADVNAKDNAGDTPLHWRAPYSGIEVAQLLLNKGAKVNEKDNNGKTPLDIAQTDEMKALLRKYGGK